MADMTKEEAAKLIDDKTTEAMNLIREAEAIADQYKLDFSFSVAYGMGGWYYGDPEDRDTEYDDEPDGWCPSSQSC